MSVLWITLSTLWRFSSVQAALNVIISALGSIGIWSFSRYWWQRGSSSILRGNSNVPLSTLFTLSSPGEGWDLVTLLGWRIFARQNWPLLFQLVITVTVTIATMLAGPIAQFSLRSSTIIQRTELQVLPTVKGDGPSANRLSANELWNDTIQSLYLANFPYNQMLDYLPPSTSPWIYDANEWDPTWNMTCNRTYETPLHNIIGVGNYTLYNPVDAFPAYQSTYDQLWLNTSEFRTQADFTGWTRPQETPPVRDVLFFILIQSDPDKDNRSNTNIEALQISISVLHARVFNVSDYNDVGEEGTQQWEPNGPVGNASYARVECEITRRPTVSDENKIPWLWTNDTYSITFSYKDYWTPLIEEALSQNQSVLTPSPEDLLRFYQTYMISVNTLFSSPSPRNVSVEKDAVQLSIIFLAMLLVLTSLTLLLSGRYIWFLKRQESKLEQVYVPDGKIEWMVHAAKMAHNAEEGVAELESLKDRDHFSAATFGYINTDLESIGTGVRHPLLARVHTSRTSTPGASVTGIKGSLSRGASQEGRDGEKGGQNGKEKAQDPNRIPNFVHSQTSLELVVSSAGEKSKPSSREPSPHSDGIKLDPQTSGKLSTDGSPLSFNCNTHSKSSFQLIVQDIGEIDPINVIAGSPK